MVTGFGAGSVVAGYRVESRIGIGGMAMVFRARDESLGRTVALKVLAPTLADDAAFRERFIRESRAAAVVDHPHIIPIFGAGEFEGVLYIAMRYVASGDLRALLQREGPLPPARAAFLLSPLASALDAGHAAGLVHRDVKPANILIDTSPGRPDHIYLSDFGLAKGNASTGLTGTGQFLGTLEYCAPEQIGGKPARPQTDQYALGCVAYTMLTGAVPFPRDEVTAVLWAHMSEPPPAVTALRSDLPPAVDQVVARAMAKDPDKRYPSCAEFADALRAALGVSAYTTPSSVYTAAGPGLPPAAPQPAPPPQPASPLKEAVPGPPAPAHAPTQSGSSFGFADTAGPIAQPHKPSPPGSRPRRAAKPAWRRAMLMAGAAVVVTAAGGYVIGLALSSPGSPPASTPGSSPTSVTSRHATQLGVLTSPDGAVPAGMAFTSDGTLVTVDNNNAYSWDIAAASPTPTDYAYAQALTSTAAPAEVLGLVPAGAFNMVEVWNTTTNELIAMLTAPSGTVAETYVLSPDGTEAAVADNNGKTYVWKITS